MYKIILIVLISLLFTACSDSSDDLKTVTTSGAEIVMNETNCYLDYVKLDAEDKTRCDTWIEENK